MTSPELQQPKHTQQPTQPQVQNRFESQSQAEEGSARETHGQESRESRGKGMGRVVHLHTAHPRVPIPYVTPGDRFPGVRTVTSAAASALSSPRKLTLYGVLGGMAVAGAIGWPVAVAVGAATEVITREQAARQRAEQERAERERSGQPAETAPAGAEQGTSSRTATA
ncbi:hypothetical protein ACIBAI_08785 [Streptomyces sp. NPDC051041]|uniref:hypothetical protein n=1 Tax=Streptomyces sp. NPDC051041 TaxID=3365640 RepID=UPI0037B6D0F5